MAGIVLVIVVVALCLIALAFINKPEWAKRTKENSELPHIEKVREAAFAVIEASLEAEPEKWELICADEVLCWLWNKQSNVAIRPSGGEVLVNPKADCIGHPKLGNGSEKFTPSPSAGRRLFKAAFKIIQPTLEDKETKKLAKMVSAFGEVKNRRADNDQAAA